MRRRALNESQDETSFKIDAAPMMGKMVVAAGFLAAALAVGMAAGSAVTTVNRGGGGGAHSHTTLPSPCRSNRIQWAEMFSHYWTSGAIRIGLIPV